MIKPISFSSLAFRANETNSARSLYDARKAENSQIAQSQNDKITGLNLAQNPLNYQVPMQGIGENLNVIA